MKSEKLIEKTIEQIKKDLENDDITSLEILLENINEVDLLSYISCE